MCRVLGSWSLCGLFALAWPLSIRGAETAASTAGTTKGIALHSIDPSAVPALAATGASVIRTDLVWWRVIRPEGGYDWAEYDRWVAALRAHRLVPMFVCGWGEQGRDGPPTTPASLDAFAAFLGAAAKRYRGALWEVWNEPNLERFWPNLDPVAYVQVLAATAAAIHGSDTSARVIGPNIGGSHFDWGFLVGSLRAGLLDHVDAVGIHPYAAPEPEDVAVILSGAGSHGPA